MFQLRLTQAAHPIRAARSLIAREAACLLLGELLGGYMCWCCWDFSGPSTSLLGPLGIVPL